MTRLLKCTMKRRTSGDHIVKKFKTVPMDILQVQDYINKNHRHHAAAHRDKFRIGIVDSDGTIIGVAQCGRPVSRGMQDGKTLEVLRLCTDGTKDACSFLYSKCARIARELGYERIITYILETESGTSLRASGWQLDNPHCGGGSWANCDRTMQRPVQMTMFQEKQKYPENVAKQRWIKYLTKEGKHDN